MIKKLLKTWLIFSIVSSSSVAFSDDNALYLTKGTVAPRDGILLTVDYANEVRIKLLERDSLQTSVDLLNKNETIYKSEIEELSNQNDRLVQTVKDERSSNTVTEIIYFALGVVTTGVVVYAFRSPR